MMPLPRYKEIDYSKYAPDIPEDQREVYYGLPRHVQFCKECVMSNQKPNSCYEFEHTIDSIKKTMVIQQDGVPATTKTTTTLTGPSASVSCASCATNIAKPTAAMTALCPAAAERTAFTPRIF